MPAAVWPSFHCRPSTARTLLSPSASTRQTPTTLTNELASPPTVSFEKLSFNGSAAAAPMRHAANAAPESAIALIVMVRLLHSQLPGLSVRLLLSMPNHFTGVKTKSVARDGFLHPFHRDSA